MEDEFSRVINALPALVWTALPDGVVDFLNQRWCDYTGLISSKAHSVGWQAIVHPEDSFEALERWRFILASGVPGELEARLRRSDGTYRWFIMSCNPMHDEAGGIVRWFAVSTDIDERKRAKEALPSGDHDLRSIIDTIPMTAWSTSADGYCDFVNQRWLDYSGLSLDQVQGWGWGAVIHPDDLEGLVEHWQSCLASGKPVNKEARMRRFDGVYRWFLFLGNPLRDESGAIVKWFGTNVDVEDRKRAEEELRANERDLIRIINTIPTTAWATRPDGYCEFLSDRWLDYAGFTYEQAEGWGWATVIHPGDLAGLQEHWLGSLANGTPVSAEARMRRFDGVYRWFLFLAKPFRDESGAIVKWFGTNVDIEDRKQGDENLRASARNLNLIISTIPILAWSTGPDGFVEFLNKRWLDYAGMTEEEGAGWGWAAAIHPEDTNHLLGYWQASMAAGTDVDVEARMRRFDGAYRWFLFRASPLRDEAGNIVKWYGTNVDIEDRKQSDEALRANERNLRQLTETIPEMLWSASAEGAIDYCSGRLLEYSGFTAEEIMENNWTKLLHPDDVDHTAREWMSCIATGTPYRVEVRTFHAADGTYRWCETKALPLLDQQGRILKWHGTVVDTHDRKRTEEELRRSEAFLAEGQRLNLSGSFSWRLDTDEVTFSDQLYRIYEFEQDTPITLERIASRVHPEDDQLVSDKIALARAGQSDLSYEVRLRMPNGSIKYLRTVAHVTRDREDRMEIVGAVQDVTERRLSEETLGQVRSELARMARVASLGALTASIAHEVSQPLSGIITNANTGLRMLAAEPPNIDGTRETVRRTLRDGNRASEVISKLRSLFSKKDYTAELVNLSEAIREVIALLMSELQRNRLVLRVELAEDLPPVTGDRIQLQQVILNLLLNASEALTNVNDRPRQVLVKTERDGGQSVRVIVQDTGVGIDPQGIDQLFDAFYTTKNGGMGMGLSVSRSIVESHHGRIWVSANVGPGAMFSFSLPCAPKNGHPRYIEERTLNNVQSVTRDL